LMDKDKKATDKAANDSTDIDPQHQENENTLSENS